MITILHGENTLASRQTLNEEKARNSVEEKVFLKGKDLNLSILKQALEAQSLLAAEKVIIIENFLSRLGRKTKDEVLEYLSRDTFVPRIILWEEKEIGKGLLAKYFPKARVVLFKPVVSIFKLVESVGVVSKPETIKLFQEVLKKEAAELVLFMLVRQFRNLLMIRDPESAHLITLPPWQRGKLHSQAKFFSLPKLVLCHRKLLEIELKLKSGSTPLSLPALLDIFFLSL